MFSQATVMKFDCVVKGSSQRIYQCWNLSKSSFREWTDIRCHFRYIRYCVPSSTIHCQVFMQFLCMSAWLWPPIQCLLTCSNLYCISFLPLFRSLISIHVLLVQEAVVWVLLLRIYVAVMQGYATISLLSALLVPSMEVWVYLPWKFECTFLGSLSGFSLLEVNLKLAK